MTITTPSAKGAPLDVWLKFDRETDLSEDDDMATHEANTYKTPDGFVIEWYLNSVGLVTSEWFCTLEEAHEWYEREGFQDFSS